MNPIMQKPIVFLDTETTGLNPHLHEIIEIAVIRVEPNGDVMKANWYIHPKHIEQAEPYALEINQYAARKHLWDEQGVQLEDAAPQLLRILTRDCIVVGHNVSFDMSFLEQCLKRSIGDTFRLPVLKIDTMTLAYEHLAPIGLKRLRLDDIRKFMGMNEAGSHSAVQDVADTKDVFFYLTGRTWQDKKSLLWSKIKHRVRSTFW